MNIYRKHETKEQDFTKKIEEKILEIKKRYADPKILIGGDFN